MKVLSYIILAVLFFGCADSQNKKLDKVSFMLGKWQNTETENMFEEWKKEESHFSGKGYSVKQKDTTVWELLTIEEQDSKLCYIADVQHNANSVVFPMVENTEMEIVFFNPEHDFPKRITYMYTSPNTMQVILLGENDKREITKELFFKKVD